MYSYNVLLTTDGIREKYLGLDGEILLVSLNRPPGKPLGIMLAGDRDPAVQAAYIVSIDSRSIIAKKKLFKIGDQLLEVCLGSFTLLFWH